MPFTTLQLALASALVVSLCGNAAMLLREPACVPAAEGKATAAGNLSQLLQTFQEAGERLEHLEREGRATPQQSPPQPSPSSPPPPPPPEPPLVVARETEEDEKAVETGASKEEEPPSREVAVAAAAAAGTTYQRALKAAEQLAVEHSTSPDAAEDARNAALRCGEIAKATEWKVESIRRHMRRGGGTLLLSGLNPTRQQILG